MISASSKKTGADKQWLVMNEQGERFGPVSFETLKLWAQDGRLAPTNTASEDEKSWLPVTQLDGLEMDWVAEVAPGAFYGPIHKQAMEALKKEGAIPSQAITFQRSLVTRINAKTQPIPSAPPAQPDNKAGDAALHALERQLALEQQRTHEATQKLQQAEMRAASSEARAEALEKAHRGYTAQAEQTQGQLTAQLDKTHQQLAQIHAQLLARDQKSEQHEQRLASVERLEALMQTHLTQLASQQQELKAAASITPDNTNLSSERVEILMKDVLAKILHNQQELKQAFETTRESTSLSSERVEALLKDDLPKLMRHQQELKQTVAATQESAALSTARIEGLMKDGFTHLTALQKAGAVEPLLEKVCCQLTAALNATQQHLQTTLSHALTHEVQALSQQLVPQEQGLQRLSAEFKTLAPLVSGQLTTVISELLDKHLEPVTRQWRSDLAEGREHLSEQTQASLNLMQEQLMRATGESQRLAIEYIVREMTTVMNQTTQSGREAFLHALQKGWTDLQHQVVTVETQLKQLGELQHRLHQELRIVLEKQPAAAPPPAVKRTVVEAEAIEVLPPERHHTKKKPAAEAPEPPPPKAEPPAAQSGAGLSMADIEQQARRELERLGAQGMNIFKRKS